MTGHKAATTHVSSRVDPRLLDRDGFLLIRDVFTDEEVEEIRHDIRETDRECGGVQTDLMSHPRLRGILLDQRIIDIFKQLIGEDLVYFGWSSFRCADTRTSPRTFHNDSKGDPSNLHSKYLADPIATNYPVFRFGLYLQDHATHSGGLKVRVGSHRQFLLKWGELKRALSGKLSWRGFPRGRLYNVPSTARDVVVFNMRTHHSGHCLRLKWITQLAFPAVLENFLERWLPARVFLPVERDRYVVFGTFGRSCKEVEWFAKNRTLSKNAAKFWSKTVFDAPENVAALEERGVKVDTVGLEYFRSLRDPSQGELGGS